MTDEKKEVKPQTEELPAPNTAPLDISALADIVAERVIAKLGTPRSNNDTDKKEKFDFC